MPVRIRYSLEDNHDRDTEFPREPGHHLPRSHHRFAPQLLRFTTTSPPDPFELNEGSYREEHKRVHTWILPLNQTGHSNPVTADHVQCRVYANKSLPEIDIATFSD